MLFPKEFHRKVFLFALAIILCSLPFSVFAISVGIITLVVNFLLEGNWRHKVTTIRSNKVVWFALLLYLPILYSFSYSSNTSIAIKELRLWLPFLFVPPVIALSNPLSTKEFKVLMLLFVLSVVTATAVSILYLINSSSSIISDIRQISSFISHIRFALMVNLAIAILCHFVFFDKSFIRFHKTVMLLVVFWLVAFLFILQSLTGVVMLFVLIIVGFLWIYFHSKSYIQRFVLATVGLSFVFIVVSFAAHRIEKFYTRNKIDFNSLPKQTINGNPYQHDTLKLIYENGNLLNINICDLELNQEWKKRSNLPLDGMDKTGQPLYKTLVRYMTSLGLTKDSVGVWKLSNDDIVFIENGASSIVFKESSFGINKRIYQLLWEIDSYIQEGTIGNSSVIQRFVFAKAAWFVIENNFWFGVGCGDVQESLNQYYSQKNVNLAKEFRFMPHNQYLTVWVGSGFFGLIIFLAALVLPLLWTKKYKHFLPLYFFAMIMVSMLNEDTFETHTGITLAVIFSSLFIFGFNFSPKTNESESTEG